MNKIVWTGTDNTILETDYHEQWRHSTGTQRAKLAAAGVIVRKYFSIWFPGGWRLRLVRLKRG